MGPPHRDRWFGLTQMEAERTQGATRPGGTLGPMGTSSGPLVLDGGTGGRAALVNRAVDPNAPPFSWPAYANADPARSRQMRYNMVLAVALTLVVLQLGGCGPVHCGQAPGGEYGRTY